MKNIDKSSVKYLIISTISIIVAGIILYPIFDMLYNKYITRSVFTYSVSQHIISPIVIGAFMKICLWLIDRNSNKNKK